jgi:cytochrome bd-type quinol oxidase subunit 1
MALAGVAFIGYGVVFLMLNFVGSGFELGVSTLDGTTKADLNPTVAYYISRLHVATAAFMISTGIAVTALSWYCVRQRLRRARRRDGVVRLLRGERASHQEGNDGKALNST